MGERLKIDEEREKTFRHRDSSLTDRFLAIKMNLGQLVLYRLGDLIFPSEFYVNGIPWEEEKEKDGGRVRILLVEETEGKDRKIDTQTKRKRKN